MIRGDGKIYCWGSNGRGQLGLGSATPGSQPSLKLATVTASFVYPISVAAGGDHSCAVDINGTAQCWGAGSSGQLGNANNTDQLSPVVFQVPAGRRVRQVSAGYQFTCALLDDTTVACAGDNSRGQLGNNSTTSSSTPVLVQMSAAGALDHVVEITTGDFHVCARIANGSVWCWGAAQANATTTDQLRAVASVGNGYRSISASGTTTCGVTSSGGLNCWGNNAFGQLGDGTTTSRATPQAVSALSNVVSVGVGVYHTCATNAGGELRCWGNNSSGQIGNGTNSSPVLLPSIVSFSGNAVLGSLGGLSHSCALTSDGLFCWGSDGNGELGNGTTLTGNQTTPTLAELPPFTDLQQIAPFTFANVDTASTFQRGRILEVGLNHTCMVVPAGSFVNVAGSSTLDGPSPNRVATTGVACWGQNSFGQLGTGNTTTQIRPRFVTGLPAGPKAVAAGANHSCALFANGTVRCWGRNNFGQLGDGTTADRNTPVEVSVAGAVLANVIAITAGDEHTCALLANGTMQCWGRRDDFRLGRGEYLTNGVSPSGSQTTPQTVRRCSCTEYCSCDDPMSNSYSNWESQLSTADGFVAISAGGAHTCALNVDGYAWCWGRNTRGQVGRRGRDVGPEAVANDYDYVRFAKRIEFDQSPQSITSISAGNEHTCAMGIGRVALCWGQNTNYQTFPAVPTAAQTCRGTGQNAFCAAVSNAVRGTTPFAVAAGGDTTCELTNTESSFSIARCWGANADAQAGARYGNETFPPSVIVAQTIGQHPAGDQDAGIEFDAGPVSATIDTFARIVPSSHRTCGLTWSGNVKCWGRRNQSNDELGRGQMRTAPGFDRVASPVNVADLPF